MSKFKANKISKMTDDEGNIIVSLLVSGYDKYIADMVYREIKDVGDFLVELKKHVKRRSLDANAYLWKLCDEIARVIRSSKDEVYLTMLERYGVFTHIIVKPNIVSKMKAEWKTVRELGEVTVNGNTGIQLQCYFGSHTYDTKEFSKLLDGVISEAKELNIDLISEQEKRMLLHDWGNKNG
jgi:hypothetical protein